MAELIMRGRGVLVAGGGRGIGRACAELLAAQGARVVVADPGVALGGGAPEGDEAAAVAALIRARGGDAVHTELGVGDIVDGEQLIALCLEELDTLDAVLVPGAVLRDRMIHNMSQADWDIVLRVNLTGLFGLLHAAVPVLRAQGYGRIVTFTSRTGLEGRAGTANYAASKMGVIGIVRAVAREVQRHGILVNCIAPRAQTRMTAHALGNVPAQGDAVDYSTLGAPEDVARLALVLASEACSVTGRVFTCSGTHLGVYPEFTPVTLAEASAPLSYEAISALIGSLSQMPT